MRGLLRSGGAGFLATCAVAAVLVAGLWLAAREGPSAQVARVVAPTPTPTATVVEGPSRFGRG
ncbi:MAG: hypothetical protein M3Q10_09265, partial [Chloroflexota bacterium]|nr:hypothetical protein [Chloroflexota bacterium]